MTTQEAVIHEDSIDPKRIVRRTIGEQLKHERIDKGISIRALAELCNINKSQICRVEAGRLNVGIDTLSTMAAALGLRLILDKDN